jgi:GT2 family glycosyltransferase
VNARLVAGAVGPPPGRYDADIIILALDRADETLAAVASALGQTDASTHLFILDQGSRPETLRRLTDAVLGRADATLLAVEDNLGVPGGRNLLSSLGHGRAIVALDNDAEFAAADTVTRILAALDSDHALAAVGCRIITFSDGRDDLSSWGYPARLLPRAGDRFDSVTFVGAGHAIRRTAWEQAGGYDASLFFCWEEYDFCLRAIALGWRVRYHGDIVIRHRVCGERRVDWSADRWFYFVRNRLHIERKLGRRWSALAPRAAGYLLKGWRNGLLLQTLRAVVAARTMGSRRVKSTMSRAAVSYLARNDRAHRGSLATRLRREVLGPIVRPPDAAAKAE